MPVQGQPKCPPLALGPGHYGSDSRDVETIKSHAVQVRRHRCSVRSDTLRMALLSH